MFAKTLQQSRGFGTDFRFPGEQNQAQGSSSNTNNMYATNQEDADDLYD